MEITKNKLSPKSPKMDHFLTILMAEKSKIDLRAKVDNFCLFCEKGKNKLSPKSPKMDHFLTILMAEKSKIDLRAKVDNFCLFCEKGS